MRKITVWGNEEEEYKEWHELTFNEKLRYLGMALDLCKIKLDIDIKYKLIAIFDIFILQAPGAFSIKDMAVILTKDFAVKHKQEEINKEKTENFFY